MRPVNRGDIPKNDDGTDKIYQDYSYAKDDLKHRLDNYCSYCEADTSNQVDIEHIIPKEIANELKNEWSNFLLACKVCNRLKGFKNKTRDGYIFPDTHNTAYAYKYTQTKVIVNDELSEDEKILAQNTIDLVDLNRKKDTKDRDDDRIKRSQVWNKALDSLQDYKELNKDQMIRQIGRSVEGFVSSWLEVFKDHPEVKKEILENKSGTAMECYDDDFNPIKILQRDA